ncbi:FtsW/RodA/SpoVE family cell cycle protein [Novisyntrophococcus fermenticellae]|uniref:FtsW/RodA/SpoVE family cell cycle protein n=1 Tax=Novisyntrophococcus fermenticellae TaxID=2068655 RepID=UPI001E618C0D|nr:FtsW/RodA/SpoVE family cell cycle protein [Novisyntrophococcus fermenticellae]
MVNVIVEISKYLLVILMIAFTLDSFLVLKKKKESARKSIMRRQIIIILTFDFLAFFVMFLKSEDVQMIVMYGCVLLYILLVQMLYRVIYKKASLNLLNNMCMLLSIGFIILSRLKIENAIKQFQIVAISTALSFLIPVFIRKVKMVRDLTWLYAVLGLLLLGGVLVLAVASRGSKLSITIGGVTFQFSEFVKITFVFFMAGMLQEDISLKQVIKTSVVAALHVGILVLSKDLGTALVFFVAYLVIVYVGTQKARYAFAGFGGLSIASVAAYFLFGHVRQRVKIWRDPFEDYANSGYQIVQSLFGICAGGWFGTGLFKGAPHTIPIATKDFTFAAICEEFGVIFGICLILLCMSTFLLIVNISMKMSKSFYRLIAIGLGAEYAIQVFLTIGGTTKFIPMTGITLPLISYGGSSVMCTIIMLAIIQGLYILREDENEGEELEKRSKKRRNQKPPKDRHQNKTKQTDDLEKRIAEQTEKSLHW